MISKETLTSEWLEKVSKANRNADKILIEKVIRAMLLLEGLANSGLPFVFKGGTALMLLLNSAKRLSIDIDIIIPKNPGNLLDYLTPIVEQQGFNRLEIHQRNTESKIDKAHYKFYYTPKHKSIAEDDNILLDVLFEADHYTHISAIEITSHFLLTEGETVFVNIPSIEDLLGDKLTAFAPETTGIPYFKHDHSHSMEIIKQLYDIGNLFDVATDLETIKATFISIATAEIENRQLAGVSPIDVLTDIYNTALCISLRGAGGNGNFPELLKGLSAISRFVFSEPYHLEKAIPHAAKTAYLSMLIANNQSSFEKFSDPAQVADAKIEAPHNTKLQKLKKSSPESFFYWWKAIQLT
jgi:predicted nucleotidyltransferase component of viral defense system